MKSLVLYISLTVLFLTSEVHGADNYRSAVASDTFKLSIARSGAPLPLIIFIIDDTVFFTGKIKIQYKIGKEAAKNIIKESADFDKRYKSTEDKKFILSFYLTVRNSDIESEIAVTQIEFQKTVEVSGILGIVDRIKKLSVDNQEKIDAALADILKPGKK